MGFTIGTEELKTIALWRAVFAEFVGMILFLVCVTTVALSWGHINFASSNIEVGIGIGLAISSLALTLGHVSGGHLNPAVTFAMFVARKVSFVRTALYIIAQMIGAILGSVLTYGFTPGEYRGGLAVNKLRDYPHPDHNNHVVEITLAGGFGVEFFFTYMLVLLVFAVTDPKKKIVGYPATLAIGIIIWVAHVCTIPYTNTGINPARSFGPAVVMNHWEHHWVFWVAPMLAGALAALSYEFVFYVDDPAPFKSKPEDFNFNEISTDTEKELLSSKSI